MRVRRWIWSPLSIPLAAALVAGLSSTLSAQGGGRPLFEWRGRVDREVRITMRGRDAWALQNDNRRGRVDVAGALPRSDGEVRVRVEDGRGTVDVVQQPSSRNDYTAIVRIRDRSGGADIYRVLGYWQPDTYGSSDGRGRDDCRWAQDRRADDRNTENRRRDDRWCDDRRGDRDDNAGGVEGGGWDRAARSTLRWSGRVDDALEIRMQGDRIWYETVSGKGSRNVRADILARGLPRDEGELRIATREGRGNVSVVQQPTARNGYTAVIRVYDPRSGYGDYDFDVMWRPMYGRR